MEEGIVGLCVLKINGLFEVEGKSARWSVRKNVAEHATGAGWEHASAEPNGSFSFEEVISQKPRDWRNLKKFTVEVIDQNTNMVVFYGEKCTWDEVGGNTDRSSASTTKNISARVAKPLTW